MVDVDPRRVPRTDAILDDARLATPIDRLGRSLVKAAVRRVQAAVRTGDVGIDRVIPTVLDELPDVATSMRAVINATGVLLHTNLGRAPLSAALLDNGVPAVVVGSQARVGGGGAPDVVLPSYAVSVPESYADQLRTARGPVLGRVERGRCLLDLRSVSSADDDELRAAVVAVAERNRDLTAAGDRED